MFLSLDQGSAAQMKALFLLCVARVHLLSNLSISFLEGLSNSLIHRKREVIIPNGIKILIFKIKKSYMEYELFNPHFI